MTPEMVGLLVTAAFLIAGLVVIPSLDRTLDNRRERREARRRNQARPWR